MSEAEPHINLNIEGLGSYELNRRNSVLYTFVGKTALRGMEFNNEQVDHVYLELPENERNTQGVYIFKANAPSYSTIAEYMMEHNFQMHLNMPNIPACDMKAYKRMSDSEAEKFASAIPDELPEDFS